MEDAKITLVILVAAWLLHHGHHYRRNRRDGFGVWYSMRVLKQGTTSLSDVLCTEDDAIAKMKVLALLQALPGVGKVRAGQIMGRLGIDPSRRVRGLGPVQRAALGDEFAAA